MNKVENTKQAEELQGKIDRIILQIHYSTDNIMVSLPKYRDGIFQAFKECFCSSGGCSVEGCTEEVDITWPLLSPEVRLCNKHHQNPPEQFKRLVEQSDEPPDDFDIPWRCPK